MTTLLILAIAATNPVELTVAERCDLVEHNSHYSECGDHTFDQLIVWSWEPHWERHVVVGWRMIRENAAREPERDWSHGGWTVTWQDGEVMRIVRAPYYRRTWTQDGYAGDPERNDLEFLPKENRRELMQRKLERVSAE